jgi:chitinase
MRSASSICRLLAFTASAAFVTVGCGGTGAPGQTTGSSTSSGGGGSGSRAAHSHCGWIGADTFDAGKASFLAQPDYFDAVHPKWATLNSDGSIRILAMADDAEIMAAAKAHNVKLMPLIDYDDKSYLYAAIGTAAGVQAHAQALTDMVMSHGYDGVDLDYEHLWSASDRAPYEALISAVTQLLHAQGKEVSLSLPAMDQDHADSAYDYTFLQANVDALHLMGYDYHYLGGDHLGPLAPKGWISDVVTHVQSLGAPEKYVLGIANYGIGNDWYASAKDTASRCNGGSYSSQTDHMTVCSYGHQEAGLAPHCTTAQGDAWFEDTGSMAEKAALAQAHGLGGVSLWTIGDEPAGFFDAIKKVFP